jgi:TRAP-type C4-dicarboxylate transport system substrate-binding protein
MKSGGRVILRKKGGARREEEVSSFGLRRTLNVKEGKTMKKSVPLFLKVFILVFAVISLFLASLAQPEMARGEPYVLKAVTAWPKQVADSKSFLFFLETAEEMVAKKYPGELKINYIGGPEAVKTQEQIHAVQTGLVDMCLTANAYYVNLMPEADAMKLSDFYPWEERERGIWAYYNDLHQKRLGIYYLGGIGLDEKFYLYLSKPIKSADLKGFNIRVSPMYLQVIKALGGNPIVIPPTEVYTALERHVVDGYCWPAVGIRDWGWQKQTKYVVEPGFYRVRQPLLVNLKTWNNLPKKLKDLLEEAAKEAERKTVAYFEDAARKERPILLKEGIQVIDLPPAEKQKFLKVAYDSAWEDILKKSPTVGAELRKLLTKGK